MPRFELEKLTSYDDQSLIDEIKRVAALIPDEKIKTNEFDRLSKVHSTTLRYRFGGWKKALAAAGLEQRYNDLQEPYSREEIISYLQAAAKRMGRNYVTKDELEAETGISYNPIHRLFGSFKKALEAAGLSQTPLARRYTDEECFENLLTVWTQLGRQPSYNHMKHPPSIVGPKVYVSHWSSWRKALAAFVERINQDTEQSREISTTSNLPPSPRLP